MRIKFIGGPFHNTIKDIRVDDDNKPPPFMDYYPLSPFQKVQTDPDIKDGSVEIDRYHLKEMWRDGRLSHYEYHYEGR